MRPNPPFRRTQNVPSPQQYANPQSMQQSTSSRQVSSEVRSRFREQREPSWHLRLPPSQHAPIRLNLPHHNSPSPRLQQQQRQTKLQRAPPPLRLNLPRSPLPLRLYLPRSPRPLRLRLPRPPPLRLSLLRHDVPSPQLQQQHQTQLQHAPQLTSVLPTSPYRPLTAARLALHNILNPSFPSRRAWTRIQASSGYSTNSAPQHLTPPNKRLHDDPIERARPGSV